MSRSQSQQASQEDERFNAYMAQRRKERELEMEGMEAENRKKIDDLTKQEGHEVSEIDQAYKVEIKHHVEMNDAKLADIRKEFEISLKNERDGQEKEFEKIREREKGRVDTYKKNQDIAIEKLHEKYLAAQDEMQKNNRG